MKLNLRKASALQMAINDKIAAVDMPISVTIDRYCNPIELVNKATSKLLDALAEKRDLFRVLYSIRQKTSAASELAGVSGLLAESAHIDKLLGMVNPLASAREFAKTEAQLNAALHDLRNEAQQPVQYAHQRRESFDVSLITETSVSAWKNEVAASKRRKQEISDALLEANVKNEIEVSELEEEILKKYGIL